MAKKTHIAKFTAEELDKKIARGESRSDWERSAAMTVEQIEASVAEDPDEAGIEIDWSSAHAGVPEPKAVLHMRVDRDVLDFFRGQGRGYQTRINAVLRTYVDQMRKAPEHGGL